MTPGVTAYRLRIAALNQRETLQRKRNRLQPGGLMGNTGKPPMIFLPEIPKDYNGSHEE